ncbi:MAG: GNAT family N-acetyltransferase [Lactobacillus sp.]|nr:GNAT family N-acetyltransferase [Lactobacillus sp.]
MYTFRKSQPRDLAAIMAIINGAKSLLNERHIPQWQNGDGPSEAIIAADIAQGRHYVLVNNQEILAIGTLISDLDPAYEAIDGAWSPASTTPYIAIHRLAVLPNTKNHGIATQMLQQLIDQSKKLGFTDIRIDTHRANLAMQHVITKTNFTYCGIVHLAVANGERLAYQQIKA